MEKRREGSETQLHSPEGTLIFWAVTSSPMSCIPPSAPTPPSPSVKSYPSHLKPWPPLPKTLTTLIVPTILMAISLALTSLDQSWLPNQSVSSLGTGPGFLASLCLSTWHDSKICTPATPTSQSPQLSTAFSAQTGLSTFSSCAHLCAFAHAVPRPRMPFPSHLCLPNSCPFLKA